MDRLGLNFTIHGYSPAGPEERPPQEKVGEEEERADRFLPGSHQQPVGTTYGTNLKCESAGTA